MEKKSLLVIRIRGTINVSQRERDTMRFLRVDRNNYASIIDDRADFKGMLQKAKDWITWGEPDVETVKEMLEKGGRLPGDARLTEEHVKEFGFENCSPIQSLAVKPTKTLGSVATASLPT